MVDTFFTFFALWTLWEPAGPISYYKEWDMKGIAELEG